MVTQCILEFAIPDISKLRCVIAIIGTGVRPFPVSSSFHLQTLFARTLIFAEKELIAAPVCYSQKEIYIIVNTSFYERKLLHSLLYKHQLEYTKPIAITNEIYKDCLTYTIKAQIAPSWNRVQQLLVQGNNFLTSSDILNAVKIAVTVNGDKAYMNVEGHHIRLPKMSLIDLSGIRNVTNSIHYSSLNPNFYIELPLNTDYIFVLPSMKLLFCCDSLNRGQVKNVSKRVPSNCAFHTYYDIKKHWKDMYGYELPATDEGMLYYTITFFAGNQFTYPDICIRRSEMVFIRRHQFDYQSIITSFESDFKSKCLTSFINGGDVIDDVKLGFLNHNLQTADKPFITNWSQRCTNEFTQQEFGSKDKHLVNGNNDWFSISTNVQKYLDMERSISFGIQKSPRANSVGSVIPTTETIPIVRFKPIFNKKMRISDCGNGKHLEKLTTYTGTNKSADQVKLFETSSANAFEYKTPSDPSIRFKPVFGLKVSKQ